MPLRSVVSVSCMAVAIAGICSPAHASVASRQAPPPATTARAAPVQPSPVTMQQNFGSWHASCSYMPTTHVATMCVVSQQLSMQQQGRAVPLGMVIVGHSVGTDGVPLADRPYELSVMTPLGFDLTKPATLTLDAAPPLSMPYIVCSASGCLSSLQATSAMIAGLRGAKEGHIRVTRIPAQGADVVTINYDMAHFLEAFTAIEAWSHLKTPS